MSYTNFVNGAEPPLSGTILNNMQVELMKLVFPIGSTYTTQTDTNPSTILNFGTWERVKGKVLVGLDEDDTDFNTIGKTGGSKYLQEHYHKQIVQYSAEGSDEGEIYAPPIAWTGTYTNRYWIDSRNTVEGVDVGNSGNLQPYQVVGYMWIRTA